MAIAGLNVKVLSVAAIKQIKASLGPRGRKVVFTAVARRLKEMTQENFGPEGPWRPEEWPPYARDYPKDDKFEGGPATLIRSGQLRRSIYVSVTDNYAEVGSDVEYAAAHQFGYAPGNLPARPYFPIHGTRSGFTLIPGARAEVEKIAADKLIQEMTK
jgi:phage gpG-like protein